MNYIGGNEKKMEIWSERKINSYLAQC